MKVQISLSVLAQSDQCLIGGGGGGYAYCEQRRCRSALGYLCSLISVFLVGLPGLGLCLPRTTKVQISLKANSHGMFLHIWQKAYMEKAHMLFCSHDMQKKKHTCMF